LDTPGGLLAAKFERVEDVNVLTAIEVWRIIVDKEELALFIYNSWKIVILCFEKRYKMRDVDAIRLNDDGLPSREALWQRRL
jgi:hypothetical protein